MMCAHTCLLVWAFFIGYSFHFMASDIRLDKWLWSMRLFKTRSMASGACRKGHVMIDGVPAKASKMIKVGDVVQLKKTPVVFSFKVKAVAGGRVGARLVPEYMEHVTTPDQLELWEMLKLDKQNARAKGLGRPTKKERRSLDGFVDETPYFVDDDWNFDDSDDDG